MLKEVFVITGGILVFHYNKEHGSSDSDEAVLSSGLLSAIRDFSEHTRSDVLESFSTENEYFIFIQGVKQEHVIIGVFDRLAPENLARNTLSKIREIFGRVKMPDIDGLQMEMSLKQELRENIRSVEDQVFRTEQLGDYVNQLLKDRTDIQLAFVVDADSKKVLARFSRPSPLFRDSQVQEFLLVHSTLTKTVGNLNLGEEYDHFTVQSPQYSIASCWRGRLLTVASGALQIALNDVVDAGFKMCYESGPDSSILVDGQNLISKSTLMKDGSVHHHEGEKLQLMSYVSLSTLCTNLDSLFKSINRRVFQEFGVVTKGSIIHKLVLERDTAEDSTSVRIFKL
ncbi:MAG: hypothetical protein ACXADL_12540 [Candidatus Thorarchaeota archaeon]|jgi:hypothetical protein